MDTTKNPNKKYLDSQECMQTPMTKLGERYFLTNKSAGKQHRILSSQELLGYTYLKRYACSYNVISSMEKSLNGKSSYTACQQILQIHFSLSQLLQLYRANTITFNVFLLYYRRTILIFYHSGCYNVLRLRIHNIQETY